MTMLPMDNPQGGAIPGLNGVPLGPQIQMPQAAPKKGGMFGSNVLPLIMGALNGYLAGRGNPVGMMGLQQMQLARQQAMQEQQHQQRRGEGFEDWVKQQAYKAANPGPANPHYFEDNSGNLMAIGPDGQPRMVHKDPLPFKLVPNGLGGVVPVDLRTLMQQQGQQPPQTLSDDDWPAQGGPTQNGSGSFPRPF